MPTTVDIVPTVGHSVLATQLGTGGTPGYDAIDLRRSFANLQEGIFASGDWKVTASTPNAMTVDVAASTGRAMVQGDTIGNQGLYVVAPHNALATGMTIGANASGNPRIDQVVLEVFDATHDGSGNNKATIAVLQGTPTAGATLDNRNGATALPNSTMRLADVLVASGAATITNAAIRDRRRWARGATWDGKRTSGGITVSAGSMTALDTANLQARLECSGGLVIIGFVGVAVYISSTSQASIAPLVDGASVDGAIGGIMSATVTSGVDHLNLSYQYAYTPGAGSHLFTAAGFTAAGGNWSLQASSVAPAMFSVKELISSSANNGTT